MSHTVVWRPKTFFYPIGNTLATSLTEYLPPDANASILALGCGDPRSVFYTIHANSKLSFDRALDFTFCDTEPAVLARNVLIFTLIHDKCDEKTIEHLWKIWFDVFIEKGSFDIVVDHCTKLVNLSSDLDRWNSSPYGALIKFCTLDTLSQLRRYWELYTFKGQDAVKLKPTVLRDMKQMNATKIGKGIVLTSARSAGVMVMDMVKLSHVHFKSYWETGVTGGDPAEARRSTHVNPSLLHSCSGDTFNLHYGSDPMACFHLAPAFLPIQGGGNVPAQGVSCLILVAKAQFSQWCRSFHSRTNSALSKTQLRFFVGDGLALCKALRYTAGTGETQTPEYADAWRATTIAFTDDYREDSADRAPLSFNVIDTSNLSDHLGPLNILIVVAPILKRDPTSALFTHSLVSTKGEDGNKVEHVSALQKIGLDLPILSLIFGIVPERVSSEFTSQSIAQEMIMSGINDSYQLFEFNIWRVSTGQGLGRVYTFSSDPMDLGEALFASYLKLYSDEGFAGIYKGSKPVLKHYTRDTFASFLSFVKDAFTGDWDAVTERLITRVQADTTLFVGNNGYQDLCRALHMEGVMSIMPSPQRFPPASHEYIYHGWNDIPRAVCVAMTVPRSKIQPLIEDGHNLAIVHCQLTGPGGNSMFWNVQTSFGRLEEVSPGPDRKLIIHEDKEGWAGTSDLIVHFVAPAWNFVQWGASTFKLALHMWGPLAVKVFRPKLGVEMCIFRTTLADSQRTYIAKDRPRLASENASNPPSLVFVPKVPAFPGVLGSQVVTLKFKGTEPVAFVARCPVTEEKAKATLADKATQVEAKLATISSVRVSFKGFESTVSFPYPVDTKSLVTRIARKSSYIEVEGRVAYTVKIPVELDPFPVVLTKTGPAELGMHHVALDTLPALRSPVPVRSDPGWLERHLKFCLTEEGRQLVPGEPNPPMWDLKESILHTFTHVLKTNKGKPTVFQLSDSGELGVHTIVFVSALRIDLTAHTVVADACVMPLTVDLITQGSFQQDFMTMNTSVVSLKTTMTDGEVPLWKAFLPTIVERCRTWRHEEGEKCEYVKEGKVPLTLETAEDPLCGCGRGKDLGGFESVKEWAPFKPYVTRAAISLPFSTSLLGGTAAEIRNMGKGPGDRPATRSAGSGPSVTRGDGCASCGQPGKPKLLFCARCKVAKYCSPACQRADWKKHKPSCS